MPQSRDGMAFSENNQRLRYRYLEVALAILGAIGLGAFFLVTQRKTAQLLSGALERLPHETLVDLVKTSALATLRMFGIIAVIYGYMLYLMLREISRHGKLGKEK